MNKTKKSNEISEKITVSTEDLAYLLSCGRFTAVEIGTAARARVQVGKRVLWNINKVKQYLDGVAQ